MNRFYELTLRRTSAFSALTSWRNLRHWSPRPQTPVVQQHPQRRRGPAASAPRATVLATQFWLRLAQQRQEGPRSLPRLGQHRPCLARIDPMLPIPSSASLQSFRRARSRAEATMQPAAPVLHGRALATGGSSRLRPASHSGGEVPRLVPVFQPSAPLCMGFIAYFWHLPLLRDPLLHIKCWSLSCLLAKACSP